MAIKWGNNGNFIFLGSKISADGDFSHEIKRHLLLGRKAMTHLDSIIKSRHITLPTKIHPVKAMVFPVVMYGCELFHKGRWVLKNWCFWTVVLEKTLESPLDCKEIQWVSPKGNQSWIFIGRTDTEAEVPYFCNLMRRTYSLEIPWCWERMKAGGERDNRGWDGWMATLTW